MQNCGVVATVRAAASPAKSLVGAGQVQESINPTKASQELGQDLQAMQQSQARKSSRRPWLKSHVHAADVYTETGLARWWLASTCGSVVLESGRLEIWF